ncbi:4-oxalocrotonate tautomerase DmpI [Methanolobus sp. ZRKC2]|uniref:4-oxalocrotonate tautomerase DmpI n=1 Tax=Methanolobus sp. ZRKC2 TaxID=3125783 RepID=UPI0024277B0C|nr:4-oxalocrotonate tautomerase family protein [Bacillota bacterium]
MPVIIMKAGKIPAEMKKELIEKLTSAASEVTNIPENAYTVLIEELDLDNIGVGGQVLSEKHAH